MQSSEKGLRSRDLPYYNSTMIRTWIGKGGNCMESLEARLAKHGPLWGNWLPDERIYRSSRCSVYTLAAQQPDTTPEFVVKVIPLEGTGVELEEKLHMAMEEIHAMERLRDCRNIVAIYDRAVFPVRTDGELIGYDVLIRMERLECLSDRLREGEQLSVEEIQVLAADMATALIAIHGAGIVHRDIKPANIYRTVNGTYQLGDFGVSKQPQAATMETMTGTTAYMAPEVAMGHAYDSRADLYSLGIVLYQLLNRNFLPLTSEDSSFSQREAAQRRRWDGARLPAPPQGSRRLRRLVLRCCAADPGKRIPTAERLLAELEGANHVNGWIPATIVGWLCAVVAVGTLFLLPRIMLARWSQMTAPEAIVESDSPETDSNVETAAPDTLETPEDTHRYTVIRAQMTWEDAKIYCESRGGHLATILDQEQFDTIAALLEDSGLKSVWLGANNLNSSAGFQWVTGDPFEFAAWAIHEPNNTNNEEHYLMMQWRDDEGWVWNDSSERGMWVFTPDTCGFVCQWDEADG